MQPLSSGRYANMDLLRYVLAFSVVIAHYNGVMGTHIPWPISSGTAVAIFFGLSGFLVYASFQRHPEWGHYLSGRIRRILPAYWLIVVSFAICLQGVSSLDAADYFSSGKFWKYLLSNMLFLNFLQPNLPGVFENHINTCVNGSLWTLKVEWLLYLTIPVFFGLIRRFRWSVPISIGVLYLFSWCYSIGMEYWYLRSGNELIHILSYQFLGQFTFFYSGVLCYHYLDVISRNKVRLAILAAMLLLLNGCMERYGAELFFVHFMTTLTTPLAFVVLAVVISVSPCLFRGQEYLGNCSYEIYLIHFPILQLAYELGIQTICPAGCCFFISCVVIVGGAWLVNQWTSWWSRGGFISRSASKTPRVSPVG